ncbi:MAG TPA: HEPN domain-containing protein [Coriobacteriia bacterium]|jgi:HEPN domain-containing protein
MDEKLELVRNWLEKARRDLAAASLVDESPEFLDIAAFHLQQSAEKAIKGLLVLNDQRFTKTHDLKVLIGQAEPFLPELAAVEEGAADLSPFAADGRYPGDVELTDRDEYERLADTAQGIYKAVLAAIPVEARPKGRE